MESIIFKVILLLFLVGFVIFLAIADRRLVQQRLAEERARPKGEDESS